MLYVKFYIPKLHGENQIFILHLVTNVFVEIEIQRLFKILKNNNFLKFK